MPANKESRWSAMISGFLSSADSSYPVGAIEPAGLAIRDESCGRL